MMSGRLNSRFNLSTWLIALRLLCALSQVPNERALYDHMKNPANLIMTQDVKFYLAEAHVTHSYENKPTIFIEGNAE